MKISRKQLRKIILEYEQYVDEDGNVYDDEGNVSRRGSSFGRRYGGQTYTGTRTPWSGRGRSSGRSHDYTGAPKNAGQIAAVKAVLDVKDNNFLRSILQQLEAGKSLSQKQKAVVKKIIEKTAKDSGMESSDALALFESLKLRRMIRESIIAENAMQARSNLLTAEYEKDPNSKVTYPYGRNRGDVRSSLVYTRKDGQPISDDDMAVLTAVEKDNHALMGIYSHSLSDDRMTLYVSYYRHTAG